MPVRGGSIPYSKTAGCQVLLLGLAHGGMASAALSTEPSSRPLSKGCGEKAAHVA